MATLPNNISILTDAEKFELLDALWEDLEAHASKLSSEQPTNLTGASPSSFHGKRNPRRWQRR
jgi:hypothetical protein